MDESREERRSVLGPLMLGTPARTPALALNERGTGTDAGGGTGAGRGNLWGRIQNEFPCLTAAQGTLSIAAIPA